MVSILSLHLPALWSGQVNLQRCVSQLEKTVLYFGVLQMMVLWWGNGSAEENAYAALCLSWYVWNNIGQEWLPTPELMKSTLVVYFVACVPILWLQSPKVAAWPPLSIPMLFLCDISLLALECISLAYGRLWELLLAIWEDYDQEAPCRIWCVQNKKFLVRDDNEVWLDQRGEAWCKWRLNSLCELYALMHNEVKIQHSSSSLVL